jgi:hypothetical protein
MRCLESEPMAGERANDKKSCAGGSTQLFIDNPQPANALSSGCRR